MANIVVDTIIKVVGADIRNYIEGKVQWQEGNKPKLQERGGVYGIAIKLATSEAEEFFLQHKDEKKDLNFYDWIPLGEKGLENYYPLYWGKDINLGFRLFEHMKSSKSTASVQLDQRTDLIGRDIIYGAVFCSKNAENEKLLRQKYPDIFKTKKLKME
ncbi:MAG: hypothetical protein E7355_05330 [Clostridiales bacterium]|nr:hypothetical protein [Clostridiales bacterium]